MNNSKTMINVKLDKPDTVLRKEGYPVQPDKIAYPKQDYDRLMNNSKTMINVKLDKPDTVLSLVDVLEGYPVQPDKVCERERGMKLYTLYSANPLKVQLARHASINDIIRRALVTAMVPGVIEFNGLVRNDGKRPVGMTIMSWKLVRPLVWDATCVDTLAPSHLLCTVGCAGADAAGAENLKRRKYNNLIRSYVFELFGVETLGPWGPSAQRVVRDISKQLADPSRDLRAGLVFTQRIGIPIQRGNAASVLSTFPIDIDLEEFFDAL